MNKWDEKNYNEQKKNSLSSKEQEPSDITISIESDSTPLPCKDIVKKRKQNPKSKTTYTCPKCNKQFVDWTCRNRTFCSRKCAGIDENMDINAPRKCTKCGKLKEPKEFCVDSTKKITGRRPDCKECNYKRSVEWGRKNKFKHYWYTAKYRYNLTEEQYHAMMSDQNGKCAICKKTPPYKRHRKTTIRLHIDHCHKTNKVRGLLCTKCNSALGLFGDDIEKMKIAIKYLRRNCK